ncbi:N-6 DNA methylase [Bengtsoniella intestinalis]|uniref:N-6 DNA methylase n=1 Tax=Bengtsoniella intestinalis TaxID=3073143 RepID=UPI00391F8FC7
MNREAVKQYISAQPNKVVNNIDLDENKISYTGITQHRTIKDITGDEEMVRAFILTRLVNELGYSPDRIEIECEYTAGRPHTITSRIDVIVRDTSGNAFLFIELKSPTDYDKADKDQIIEQQLFKLAGMERTEGRAVKYLVLYATRDLSSSIADECIVIDAEKFPTYADWEATRDSVNTLPARYGKAQKTPYIKASTKDLETDFSTEALTRLQTDLHNVLWGGGGTDDNEVFSSLVNLILAKIQDEDEKEDGDAYDFQSLTFAKDGDEEFETNEQLFDRINTLYRKALKQKMNLTDEKELDKSYVIDSKKFSLSKLKYTVQKLEGLSFVDGKNSLDGKDILGDFFEGIIRDGFKQTKGQFFTPMNIVKFMLWAIQADKLAIKRIKEDKEIPYMIDPSTGSGTFLIEYMKFITANMKYRNRNADGYNADLGTARAVKDKITSDWFFPNHRENKWAQTFIYGSEINFNLGTATKVNMILHGDGSTNIFVKDGLLPFAKYEKETAPNALQGTIIDENYTQQKKTLNVNEQFDIILGNL